MRFSGRFVKGWMNTAFLLTFALAVIACSVTDATAERFVEQVKLASGETVVVEEPTYEARSLGSFTVRVYASAGPHDATTFFQSGVVISRDGEIATADMADLDGDGVEEIIVTARSVGTGNYLSAWAFSYRNGTLSVWSEVSMLPPDADPLKALRAASSVQ